MYVGFGCRLYEEDVSREIRKISDDPIQLFAFGALPRLVDAKHIDRRRGDQQAGIDPISWTPDSLGEGTPRFEERGRPIGLSFVNG